MELAPRNRDGRVEFAADVSVLLPVDRARASGRVMLDVVNRGNTVAVPNFNHATRPVFGPGSEPNPDIDVGDGFLMRRGWVVISCGWQADVPEIAGLYRLYAPEARDAAGQRLTGRVYTQLQSHVAVPHMLLSDRGHLPYAAADLDQPDALLTVRDMPDAPGTPIPRERWRFARAVDGRVVPDARHVHLDGGFEKGRLYRISYTAVGAPVLGLSLAALRDSVSWLKHGGAAEGNPAPGAIRWGYAYGRSQTGRLLRTLVYEDLNVDEAGREALDGIIANVAGGMRGEFNQRFGQNSKDRPHMMAHVFPSADTPQTDAATGRTDALHARADARGSRAARLLHQLLGRVPPGRRLAHPHRPRRPRATWRHGPHVRVYHFAGTEHGLGVWPPTDTQAAAADATGTVERSQNVRGTLDYGRLLRACLVNLDRWVTEGVEPPPSRHPRVDDGTAVEPGALATVFARIPGAHYPPRHPLPLRLDFGADPCARRRSRRAKARRGARGYPPSTTTATSGRHPAARADRAARHAHRLDAPPSGDRRGRAAPRVRGRHHPVRAHARRARGRGRPATIDRGALRLARRVSRRRARGGRALAGALHAGGGRRGVSDRTPPVSGSAFAGVDKGRTRTHRRGTWHSHPPWPSRHRSPASATQASTPRRGTHAAVSTRREEAPRAEGQEAGGKPAIARSGRRTPGRPPRPARPSSSGLRAVRRRRPAQPAEHRTADRDRGYRLPSE